MSKQHTLGPWVYRGGQIDARDGTVVQPNAISWAPDGDLIAAAPDLYEACKIALARIDPTPRFSDVPLEPWAQEACDALRAAIRKVEG